MAISKRKSCNGMKDGKKCRKWKELNENGFCEKCAPASLVEDDDDRCGMCPTNGENSTTKSGENSTTKSDDDVEPEMIQCNLCEDWFHSSCVGSKDYYEFIGRDEPAGTDHSKGGLAVHLWFCGGCYTKYTDMLNTLKASFRKSIALPFGNKIQSVTDCPSAVEAVITNTVASNKVPTEVKAKVPYTSSDRATLKQKVMEREAAVNSEESNKASNSICKYYYHGRCRHGIEREREREVVRGKK